jgi:hypothetical protein
MNDHDASSVCSGSSLYNIYTNHMCERQIALCMHKWNNADNMAKPCIVSIHVPAHTWHRRRLVSEKSGTWSRVSKDDFFHQTFTSKTHPFFKNTKKVILTINNIFGECNVLLINESSKHVTTTGAEKVPAHSGHCIGFVGRFNFTPTSQSQT